jgi:2-desacetyl-2-hydroxyethyl bacteriochlorophyllide A dehydrogenase
VSEQLPQINVITARARRLSYKQAGSAVIEDCQLADINDNFVTIKTMFSGISRGTESLVYHGKVPESEEIRMRCPNQVGDFTYPVSYGYACVGEIIEIQSEVKTLHKGDHVFVLHPHQDLFTVEADACNLLPKGLSPQTAVLAANMETALNATWDGELGDTSKHLIIGAGVVGLLTAYCVKTLSGFTPTIVDINADKRQVAEALGLEFRTVSDFTKGSTPRMERIFNSTASASGLQLAIDSAAFEARIIEMSWFGDRRVSLDLGGAFHSQRLQIISSQVGHISPSRRDTHDYPDRMREAMKLLTNPALDALLETGIGFEALPNHLDDIFSADSNILCQLVNYQQMR